MPHLPWSLIIHSWGNWFVGKIHFRLLAQCTDNQKTCSFQVTKLLAIFYANVSPQLIADAKLSCVGDSTSRCCNATKGPLTLTKQANSASEASTEFDFFPSVSSLVIIVWVTSLNRSVPFTRLKRQDQITCCPQSQRSFSLKEMQHETNMICPWTESFE